MRNSTPLYYIKITKELTQKESMHTCWHTKDVPKPLGPILTSNFSMWRTYASQDYNFASPSGCAKKYQTNQYSTYPAMMRKVES